MAPSPAFSVLALPALALVFSSGFVGAAAAQLPGAQLPGPGDIRPLSEVIPAGAETHRGLFHVHRVGERWYYEIPDSGG